MSATIIAEALAAAERGTHVTFGTLTRVVVVDDDECVSDLFPGLSAVRTSDTASEDGCVYVHLDAVQIALAHLAAKLERAEAQLEAISREGWRACGLLASLREAVSDVADYYVDTPGAGQAAAERIRAALAKDAEREAGR